MTPEVLSVTELREFVNQTLAYAYPAVVVEGEVASFRVNQGKWIFFDLKDSDTTISCFMTKYQLNTVLEDGMLVRVSAVPNLTKWGKFSLTVKSVELAGAGEVKQAFEKMKAQFEAEGLFAEERKRALPTYPEKIGLITSTEAAAFNDFITIARDRWPLMEVIHTHVQVQGDPAVGDVVGALQYLNQQHSELEAIIIIRGGGSAEDLQVFNTEPVVRAIYASAIPTIVGIGHEDDVSLAELVADVRAATPTDAARRLTPDQVAVGQQLGHAVERQTSALQRLAEACRQSIRRVTAVYGVVERLAQERLRTAARAFDQAWQARWQSWQRHIAEGGRTLHASNPERILGRGYAIARVGDEVVMQANQLPAGAQFVLQLRQGNLGAVSEGEVGAPPSVVPSKPVVKPKKEPQYDSGSEPQTSIDFS